jgi:tyrosine-protein phosphatase YwqE
MDEGVVEMIATDHHRRAIFVTVGVMIEVVDSSANVVGREVLREEGLDVGIEATTFILTYIYIT